MPDSDAFVPMILRESLSVRQGPRAGIVLTVNKKPLFELKASYQCCMDRYDDYLAILESKFEIIPHLSAEQLMRFEYVRDYRNAPVAHAHVHAPRAAFDYLMDNAGTATRRARQRGKRDDLAPIQDLHFPLGGHRFRPCLEDILETLIDEFGVDHELGAMEALADGREAWRRGQTKAVVRDDPESAIGVLRKLGYDVEWTSDEPEPPIHWDRLRKH